MRAKAYRFKNKSKDTVTEIRVSFMEDFGMGHWKKICLCIKFATVTASS